MSKKILVNDFMNEVILIGGIPLRRYDALTIVKRNMINYKKGQLFGPDYQVFSKRSVNNIEPWTLEEFLEFEDENSDNYMKIPKRFKGD